MKYRLMENENKEEMKLTMRLRTYSAHAVVMYARGTDYSILEVHILTSFIFTIIFVELLQLRTAFKVEFLVDPGGKLVQNVFNVYKESVFFSV